MQSRMKHPAFMLPGAMEALQALSESTKRADLPASLLELVSLRASQINGCSVCVDGHHKILKKIGEKEERIVTVVAWRDAPYFTDAERAALALTEALTRIADKQDPVPDDVWVEAARHYEPPALSALLIAIAGINVWNRLNVATKQVAGEWKP